MTTVPKLELTTQETGMVDRDATTLRPPPEPPPPWAAELMAEVRKAHTESANAAIAINELSRKFDAVDRWMGSINTELGHLGRDVQRVNEGVKEIGSMVEDVAKRAGELVDLRRIEHEALAEKVARLEARSANGSKPPGE